MPLDPTGVTLGTLVANTLNLPPPPTNPTPEQQAQYEASKAANLATQIAIAQQYIQYFIANCVVTVTVNTTDTVTLGPQGVATIIAPPTGGPCTGTGTGNGTGTGSGTGTIK